MSSKTSSHESEEEEKQPSGIDEEKLCDSYANYLLGQLKTIGSEENAFALIKKCMFECRNHGKKKPRSEMEKQKDKEKTESLYTKFVKTLVRDNNTLKVGIRRYTQLHEENSAKVKQFDNLAQSFNQLMREHEQLKRNYNIAKYAAAEK
jgi:cell division protein FtsB